MLAILWLVSLSFSWYRFTGFTKCVWFCLYLWNQVISLTSSVTPTAWLLFRMSGMSLFIPCGCVPCTTFWVFSLWEVHKEVSNNKVRACLTWNSIVELLWVCQIKDRWSSRTMADFEVWGVLSFLCVMCVAPVNIHSQQWRCMEYVQHHENRQL